MCRPCREPEWWMGIGWLVLAAVAIVRRLLPAISPASATSATAGEWGVSPGGGPVSSAGIGNRGSARRSLVVTASRFPICDREVSTARAVLHQTSCRKLTGVLQFPGPLRCDGLGPAVCRDILGVFSRA